MNTNQQKEKVQQRKATTIADAIAEYKATRDSSAVKLLHRVLDKIIGLKCPHCGNDVPIVISH